MIDIVQESFPSIDINFSSMVNVLCYLFKICSKCFSTLSEKYKVLHHCVNFSKTIFKKAISASPFDQYIYFSSPLYTYRVIYFLLIILFPIFLPDYVPNIIYSKV